MLKTGLREGAAKEDMREQLRRIAALLNKGLHEGEADPNLLEVTEMLLIIVTAMPDPALVFNKVFTKLTEATHDPTLLFRVFAEAGPTIELILRSGTARGAEPDVRQMLHEQEMEDTTLHVRPGLTRLLNAVGQSLGLGKIALEYSDRCTPLPSAHVDMRHKAAGSLGGCARAGGHGHGPVGRPCRYLCRAPALAARRSRSGRHPTRRRGGYRKPHSARRRNSQAHGGGPDAVTLACVVGTSKYVNSQDY
jgi:hypothetical protein